MSRVWGISRKEPLVNATLVNSRYEEMDTEVANTYEPMQRKQRRPEPRRKGHGGSAGGGMHCRSNKSHTWGTGAGARLADLRAFAGAVALVVFGLLSPVSAADTFTWKTVGSIGNAPNPTTGLGRVTENFKISAYDTTIAQYADFLNNSYAGKQGLYGVWNSSIGAISTNQTEFGTGISRSGSAGSYTYAVNSGFDSKPVNYVNWFSAARFVNWYANKQSQSANATETGSYTLDGKTTGNIVPRNADAQVFLPSADEWTKAAFYNPQAQDYYLWPTQSNTQPTAVLPVGNATVTTENTANYRDTRSLANIRMTNVGTYVNTTSTYGLFDMLGNVTQMTDTTGTGADAGKFQAFGGSYLTTAAQMGPTSAWNSDGTGEFRVGAPSATEGFGTAGVGFRVAAIAVPEPGNMVAAAMGIGGLIGVQLVKRRKLALARAAA
jgi:formylglycine-generating enzyme required for sulfatase activity